MRCFFCGEAVPPAWQHFMWCDRCLDFARTFLKIHAGDLEHAKRRVRMMLQ